MSIEYRGRGWRIGGRKTAETQDGTILSDVSLIVVPITLHRELHCLGIPALNLIFLTPFYVPAEFDQEQ
jgi:hypothetical protein